MAKNPQYRSSRDAAKTREREGGGAIEPESTLPTPKTPPPQGFRFSEIAEIMYISYGAVVLAFEMIDTDGHANIYLAPATMVVRDTSLLHAFIIAEDIAVASSIERFAGRKAGSSSLLELDAVGSFLRLPFVSPLARRARRKERFAISYRRSASGGHLVVSDPYLSGGPNDPSERPERTARPITLPSGAVVHKPELARIRSASSMSGADTGSHRAGGGAGKRVSGGGGVSSGRGMPARAASLIGLGTAAVSAGNSAAAGVAGALRRAGTAVGGTRKRVELVRSVAAGRLAPPASPACRPSPSLPPAAPLRGVSPASVPRRWPAL